MKGLVIGRFQPFHYGHLGMIEWAASKCDYLTIGIGSSNKSRTDRNPYTFEERKRMIEASLKLDIPYQIIGVPDQGNNYKWAIWITDNIDFDIFMTNSDNEYKIMEGAGRQVMRIDFDNLNVKGTQVRQTLAEKGDCIGLVPKGTIDVIKEVKL